MLGPKKTYMYRLGEFVLANPSCTDAEILAFDQAENEVKKDSDTEEGSDSEEETVMPEENTPPPNDVASESTRQQKTSSMSFVSKPGNDTHRKPFEHLASMLAEKKARDEGVAPVEEPVAAVETPIEKSGGRGTRSHRKGASPSQVRRPSVQRKETSEGHPKGMIIPNAIDSTFFGAEFT